MPVTRNTSPKRWAAAALRCYPRGGVVLLWLGPLFVFFGVPFTFARTYATRNVRASL